MENSRQNEEGKCKSGEGWCGTAIEKKANNDNDLNMNKDSRIEKNFFFNESFFDN